MNCGAIVRSRTAVGDESNRQWKADDLNSMSEHKTLAVARVLGIETDSDALEVPGE